MENNENIWNTWKADELHLRVPKELPMHSGG